MADKWNRDDDEQVSGAADERMRGVSDADDDEFDDDADADDLDEEEDEEEGTTF